MNPLEHHLATLSRRQFFRRSGVSLGSVALSTLLRDSLSAAPTGLNPLAARHPHFAARAKRVIYLHMIGAPSQLDLFEQKPELVKRNGQTCPEELLGGILPVKNASPAEFAAMYSVSPALLNLDEAITKN